MKKEGAEKCMRENRFRMRTNNNYNDEISKRNSKPYTATKEKKNITYLLKLNYFECVCTFASQSSLACNQSNFLPK